MCPVGANLCVCLFKNCRKNIVEQRGTLFFRGLLIKNDWDSIEPESVDGTNRLVTFKTKVLGLFRVGVEK